MFLRVARPTDSYMIQLLNYKEIYEAAIAQETINQKSTSISFRMKRDTLNLEELYQQDIKSGKGFLLDENVNYNDNKDPNINLMIESDSIHSYKFGVRSNDTAEIKARRCVCKCGETYSEMTGRICPLCGTKTELDVKIRGWFHIRKYKVFNPDWLQLFTSHLNKTITKTQLWDNLWKRAPKGKTTPHFTIMDIQQRKKLVEMIHAYVDPEFQDFFLKKIDCALTSKIPVISKDFRYFTVETKVNGEMKINQHPQNNQYIAINDRIRYLNNLSNSATTTTILSKLGSIQTNWKEIYDDNLDILGRGKQSYIRSKVGGQRKENSGRMVVEGITHYRNDVISIPYAYFGELMIEEHRDLFLKHGMTPDGETRMRNNFPNIRDEAIMDAVLRDLHDLHKAYAFLSRAPVIYTGSIQSFEIFALSRDLVIRIPEIALAFGFSGDKDGDIFSLFILPSDVRLPTFFAFNPRKQSYNPITQLFQDEYELPESLYFIAYKLFDELATRKDEGEDVGSIIISKKEALRLSKIQLN